MPRYRAKALCFVDGHKVRAGDTFTTDQPFNASAWDRLDSPPAEKPAPAKASKNPTDDPAAAGQGADKESEDASPEGEKQEVDAGEDDAGAGKHPFAGKTRQEIEDFITMQGGSVPPANAKIETVVARAMSLINPDGTA
jgi:hypothetical protein